eukprot:scaffold2186_cov68-Phaeocystis_antarctica.AAC.1
MAGRGGGRARAGGVVARAAGGHARGAKRLRRYGFMWPLDAARQGCGTARLCATEPRDSRVRVVVMLPPAAFMPLAAHVDTAKPCAGIHPWRLWCTR